MLTPMILFNPNFIVTQLTTLFLEIVPPLVSVTSSFFPGSFSNLGAVPDIWLGPNKHLLNAKSGNHFLPPPHPPPLHSLL